MTTVQDTRMSLVSTFAEKIGVEPAKLLTTLKQTVFKQPKDGAEISDAQMMALLAVANQYGLDPFAREIFAFPDKGGGIVPVVSVDGWVTIINSHPAFDGMEFFDHKTGDKLEAITCRIYRKDRAHPTEITEYMSECKRNTDPWNKSPSRMLRHKALIQCGRYAFGFSGIYDRDEAERIAERDVTAGTVVERRSRFDQAATNQIERKEPTELESDLLGDTVVINGEKVNTETGEIISEPKDGQLYQQEGSPGYSHVIKQLRAATTAEEIRILVKSTVFTKMTASERTQATKYADEKLLQLEPVQAGA